MKNNTASNRLGKLVIRERFEAITGVTLNAQTLYCAMTKGYDFLDNGFRQALRDVFRSPELSCDMRKNVTWETLARAIAAYNALSTVETPTESEESPRGTNLTNSAVDSSAKDSYMLSSRL